MMIGILDLGLGNLANVKKAVDGTLISRPEQVGEVDKLILPGVGNFGEAMKRLEPFQGPLLHLLEQDVPFLGIYLGMQLLFEASEERDAAGLGVLEGRIVELNDCLAPHIGWNQVDSVGDTPLLEGLSGESYFYFTHSYYLRPNCGDLVMAVTMHGVGEITKTFPAVIRHENLMGTQFHPEKSGRESSRSSGGMSKSCMPEE